MWCADDGAGPGQRRVARSHGLDAEVGAQLVALGLVRFHDHDVARLVWDAHPAALLADNPAVAWYRKAVDRDQAERRLPHRPIVAQPRAFG